MGNSMFSKISILLVCFVSPESLVPRFLDIDDPTDFPSQRTFGNSPAVTG